MSFWKKIDNKGIENNKIKENEVRLNNSFIKKSNKIKENKSKEDKNKSKKSKSEKNNKVVKKKSKREIKKQLINDLTDKVLNLIKEPYDLNQLKKNDINKIFLNVKKELNLVKKVIKKNVKKKSNNKKTNDSMINEFEIQKIMAEAKKFGLKNEIIATLFFKLGLKLFQIAELRIENIDFDLGKIKIDNQIFEMDSNTAAKILAFIGSKTSGVLIHDNNKPISKEVLLGFIKKIMDAADVNKKDNIESLVEKFFISLRKEGKPYMYWDYIDKVVEIRTKSIKKD